MEISGWRGAGTCPFLGKFSILFLEKRGARIALEAAMTSSLDTLYKKMASSLESNGAGHMHVAESDLARHISPAVAHELNNLLTIIQGYADRLMTKHGQDPTLNSQLKLISEAAKRASALVHTARTASEPNPQVRPQPTSLSPATVA